MSNSRIDGTIKKYRFSILKPAGNDTALVHAVINSLEKRKEIADAILEKFTNVEQVGFINIDKTNGELMMTGGEFCGNATRSAAYKILSGNTGELKIKTSGVKNKLKAGFSKDGEAYSQMPVYKDTAFLKIDPTNNQNYTVTMEGIVHYIDYNTDQIKDLTEEQIKQKARIQMADLGIDQNIACGIIYTERKGDSLRIYPVVYVKNADTLYFETACGSGTTALGLVEALESKKSIENLSIMQPSGLPIKISVDFDGNSFGFTKISSPIENLYEGEIQIGDEITFHPLKGTVKPSGNHFKYSQP